MLQSQRSETLLLMDSNFHISIPRGRPYHAEKGKRIKGASFLEILHSYNLSDTWKLDF